MHALKRTVPAPTNVPVYGLFRMEHIKHVLILTSENGQNRRSKHVLSQDKANGKRLFF